MWQLITPARAPWEVEKGRGEKGASKQLLVGIPQVSASRASVHTTQGPRGRAIGLI